MSEEEQKQLERTTTLMTIKELVATLDDEWLDECIQAHSRFVTVGVLTCPPLDYHRKFDEMEHVSKTARALKNLKKVMLREVKS